MSRSISSASNNAYNKQYANDLDYDKKPKGRKLQDDSKISPLNGLNSKLDTESIINAKLSPINSAINKYESEKEFNDEKTLALKQLKGLLFSFNERLKPLNKNYSVADSNSNIFAKMEISASVNNYDQVTKYINANIIGAPIAGEYQIAITNIAAAKSIITTYEFTSRNEPGVVSESSVDGVFVAGSFQIQGPATTAEQIADDTYPANLPTITLTTTDTLNDISSKINTLTAQTGVSSYIVATGLNKYSLILTATQTGVSNAFTIVDNDLVLNGITAPLTTALDANFTFNTIPITRPTNKIDDLIDGLSIDLKTPTAGSIITLNVSENTDEAFNGIVKFVDAYNNIIEFYNQNTRRSEENNGDYADDAYLAKDWMVNNLIQSMSTILQSPVIGGSDLLYNMMVTHKFANNLSTSIGISFETEVKEYAMPKLIIDEEILLQRLSTNLEDVRKVFEFQQESNASNFSVYKHTEVIKNDISISLDLNVDLKKAAIISFSNLAKKDPLYNKKLTGTFKPNDANDLTKGGLISINSTGYTGATAQKLNGLLIYYKGTGKNSSGESIVDSATIKMSFGIIDQIQKLFESNNYNDLFKKSPIDRNIEELGLKNSLLNSEIDNKKLQMDMQRQAMVKKFSDMEGKIGEANHLKMYLDTLTNSKQK